MGHVEILSRWLNPEACKDTGDGPLPETTSPYTPETNAEVLGCLVRARRRMAAALELQDELIAHYRSAVRA